MSNPLFVALLALIASNFRTRAALQAEILALRHQLAVLQASAPRHLRLQSSDRVLWVLLSRLWSGWRLCLQIVQPATVSLKGGTNGSEERIFVRLYRIGYWTSCISLMGVLAQLWHSVVG